MPILTCTCNCSIAVLQYLQSWSLLVILLCEMWRCVGSWDLIVVGLFFLVEMWWRVSFLRGTPSLFGGGGAPEGCSFATFRRGSTPFLWRRFGKQTNVDIVTRTRAGRLAFVSILPGFLTASKEVFAEFAWGSFLSVRSLFVAASQSLAGSTATIGRKGGAVAGCITPPPQGDSPFSA